MDEPTPVKKGLFSRLRARAARAIRGRLPPRLAALFAEDAEYTIGVGPQLGAALVAGANVGGGLFVNKDGLGHYGSVGVMAGALANLSAGLHFTLVKGGADDFLGVAHLVGVSVAPAFTVVSLLYTREHELLGVTVEWSFGHAMPIEAFGGALKTFGRAWNAQVHVPAPAPA